MNSDAVELRSSLLQEVLEGSQVSIDPEIHQSKPSSVEPLISSALRDEMEPPEDELVATKYRSTTISTPPPTPKDTPGGEITDLPPPQNATPLPAGTVPLSERPNMPTHPIPSSYEIGDEFICAPVPTPEADPTSHLPKHLMPNFYFSYSTIKFLAEQQNRDLDDNIAVVCQKFQEERDIKNRALSRVTALQARCTTLEQDISGFAHIESRKSQAEIERKRLDEISLLNEKLSTVEQKFLAAQEASKMAEDAHIQKLNAADQTRARILADSESCLKRQRVIHFLIHTLLLLLLVFFLLDGVPALETLNLIKAFNAYTTMSSMIRRTVLEKWSHQEGLRNRQFGI
ncbi:hypothetical protein TWF569_008673 [Orbilia oligospora]|nr:hypothetical protein TWF569_008673 [Orbilia oligospora]